MYTINTTKQYVRDLRKLIARGIDVTLIDQYVEMLANDVRLPAECKDHPLEGEWKGFREFHVGGAGDWLVIYKRVKNKLILTLTRTGRHQDVFKE